MVASPLAAMTGLDGYFCSNIITVSPAKDFSNFNRPGLLGVSAR